MNGTYLQKKLCVCNAERKLIFSIVRKTTPPLRVLQTILKWTFVQQDCDCSYREKKISTFWILDSGFVYFTVHCIWCFIYEHVSAMPVVEDLLKYC